MPTAMTALVSNACLWAAQAAAPDAPQNPLGMIWIFAAMGLMLWFIVLRPQGRERKERQKKLDALKKGDRVITIGGMHAQVAHIDSDRKEVSLEISASPRVVVVYNTGAIQTVLPAEDPAGKNVKKG